MGRKLYPVAIAALCFAGMFGASNTQAADDIERGKYLLTAGNCASCHTVDGGEFMAGGLKFDTPFGGIYSTNITPDPDTGIGSWTAEQFLTSMREGVRPNGQHLYPVFPYTAYTKMTDEDILAIFSYLQSITAVRQRTPENELSFPFNQRSLLFMWKALFFDEGPLEPDATQTDEWNRGAYLVEALAHCSVCHTPRNFMGAEKSSLRMTGGTYNDKVPTGDVRPWAAPNLTSAQSGLGLWPVEEIAAYLQNGQNRFVTTFGPMNEVILNSTRYLDRADVNAMAVYLNSLEANEQKGGPAPSAEVMRQGETLYNVHCGTCHLPTGLGGDDSGPQLANGSLVVRASNPASLINVILYGPELPDPPLPTERWKPMEPFGDLLSDEELAALATFVRNSWGNSAGAVNADQVKEHR